ncbi:MAG: hypothetical protein WC842_01710 [Candidatus Paceibacterota bacterium]|jgi:hypothetical protein
MVANSFHTSKKFFSVNRNSCGKKKEKIQKPKVKKNIAKSIVFARCNAAAEIDAIMRFLERFEGMF